MTPMRPLADCSTARAQRSWLYDAYDFDGDVAADGRQSQRRRRIAGHDQQLDSARLQKTRVFDGVTLDRLERFCSVGHARRIAQIDEMLCGQHLVQRAIDGQSPMPLSKIPMGNRDSIGWVRKMMMEAQGIEP